MLITRLTSSTLRRVSLYHATPLGVTTRRERTLMMGSGVRSTEKKTDDGPTKPMPSTIKQAWKEGLAGNKPPLKLRTEHQLKQSSSSSSSSSRRKEPSKQDGVEPKKSLLQTYLALDKRSQRFISISVFLWSLSGYVYFTWFVEPPGIGQPK